MSEQRDKAFVQHAIDTGLESMQGNPFLAQRIMNQERTEQPVMKKKISLAFILAMVLLVACIATAVAGAINEDFNAWLYQVWPEAALKLMPVNMTCENQGIRMELISAAAEDTDVYLTFSMQDLEGDRLREDTEFNLNCECYIPSLDNSERYSLDALYPWGEGLHTTQSYSYKNLDYNAEDKKLICGASTTFYAGKIPTVSGITTQIFQIINQSTSRIDLIPYYQQYGSQVTTTTVPQNAQVMLTYDCEDYLSYPEVVPDLYSGPIPDAMHVLDWNNSLEIPLADTVYLSGIGMVDGLLHVQLHYINHQPITVGDFQEVMDLEHYHLDSDSYSYYPDAIRLWMHDKDEGLIQEEYRPEIGQIGTLGWGSQPESPYTPEWVEMIFTFDPETADWPEFYAEIKDIHPINGYWEIDIPVRLVRNAQ